MSIRQHRIDSTDKIKSKIAELKGRKITLVLASSVSVLGELKNVDDSGVEIVNGLLKMDRYSFSEIKELYFDQNV